MCKRLHRETQYFGAINTAWTDQFGSYNVSTQMVQGSGGLIAGIAYGVGGRPRADVGGPNLYLNTLVGATPSQQSYSYGRLATSSVIVLG
jgi:hypothetical protein